MSYHDLSSCTLNADERREEANRLVNMINDEVSDQLTEKEAGFLAQMEDGPVSVKQLFWLRDIKDKYL
jgi:hypothetical protein